MASTEMDLLKQNTTSLLATEEVEKSGHEKESEDEVRGKISTEKAQLTEENQKIKAEDLEELTNLQSKVTEMEYKEMVSYYS